MGCLASKSSEEGEMESNFTSVAKTLDSEQKQRLKDIFDDADVDSASQLDLSFFLGGSVQVGPHQASVLKHLKAMDENSDGFITAQEWDSWFSKSLACLSDEEFTLIVDDIAELMQKGAAVMRGTRMSEAAADESGHVEEGEEGDEAAPEPPPELPDARRLKVDELFNAWDFEGTGEINTSKLQTGSVKLGPHEAGLFSNLELMDANNDGIVSQEEINSYFQRVSPVLSDGEFDDVISEMLELAGKARLIAELTVMANETPRCPLKDDEDDDEAPPEAPPLAGERKARVEALFSAFVAPGKDSIPVGELSSAKIKVGPHDSHALSQLASMDLNHDGEITCEEMLAHFGSLGGCLSDGEFDIIIDELMSVSNLNVLTKELTKE